MLRHARRFAVVTALAAVGLAGTPLLAHADPGPIIPPDNGCGGTLANYAGSTYRGFLNRHGEQQDFQVMFSADGSRATSIVTGPTARRQTDSPVSVHNKSGDSMIIWGSLSANVHGDSLVCRPGTQDVVAIAGEVEVGGRFYPFRLEKIDHSG